MTLRFKVLTLAVSLAGAAAAADPEMMSLVMPDARMLMEIKVARIMASPIGSAMKDAMEQGIHDGLQNGLNQNRPELRQIAALSNIDWSHEVQDVVIAGGPGKPAQALIIVRTGLAAAQLQSIGVLSGDTTEYKGVTLVASAKPGNGVVAILDNSILLLGQADDVKAAIDRRGKPHTLPPALAAQISKNARYDIWFAQIGSAQPISAAAANSPGTAKAAEYLSKLAAVNGGINFSPDFDLAADIEARTDKAAGEITEGLHWFTGLLQSQAKGENGKTLEGLKYQLNGRHILLSLHVPAAEMRQGLLQVRASQAHHGVHPMMGAMPAAAAAPSSGVPPPPPGTVRVWSSDMGTVLIPVGKTH